jgi:hypothetical protein
MPSMTRTSRLVPRAWHLVPCLAPRAERLVPCALCLAPGAWCLALRLAPRALRRVPRASRLVPRALCLVPRAACLALRLAPSNKSILQRNSGAIATNSSVRLNITGIRERDGPPIYRIRFSDPETDLSGPLAAITLSRPDSHGALFLIPFEFLLCGSSCRAVNHVIPRRVR